MTRKNLYAVGGGALTGSLNGIFGGGGGMVAVPYLEQIAGYPAPNAHATAIAAVLPATLVSAAVYLYFGLVPFSVLLPAALGVLLGGFLGAKLLSKLPPRYTSIAFAVVMLIAGVRMML